MVYHLSFSKVLLQQFWSLSITSLQCVLRNPLFQQSGENTILHLSPNLGIDLLPLTIGLSLFCPVYQNYLSGWFLTRSVPSSLKPLFPILSLASFRIVQLLSSFCYIPRALLVLWQLDTVFLDICKAFDSVPHDQILLKLWNLGITGSVRQLIKSYLTGPRQCVRVEGQLSGWLPVCSGVRQGSILGPLLFLTYINDLSSFVSFSSTLLFADDTKLSRLVSSPHCSELQADIRALQQWSSSSELSFNSSKSSFLRFCTILSPISVDYDLNGSSIPSVSHGQDLGILFSSDLSWSEHYKLICSSAYRQLSLLKRTFSTACPSHIKKLMYISLVHSRLTYCSQVWWPMLFKDIVTLERVQRRATKFIVAASSVSYHDRLITLNLLPLMYFYEYLDLLIL